MFLRFSLHKAKALKVSDHPLDPFNRVSEFYQTWQLSDLEHLEDKDDASVRFARQGFSASGAPDDGVSFDNGQSRVLDDPTIAFVLPELADGQKRTYRLDIHYWESDQSSEKVRAAFTDSTLKVLLKAYAESGQNEAAAKAALSSWLRDNDAKLVKQALAAAAVTEGSWVGVGLALLPLLHLVVDVVKSNSDDYIGLHKFVLQFDKPSGQAVRWRLSSPSAPAGAWTPVDTVYRSLESIEDAEGRNSVQLDYSCIVLS